MLRIRIAQLIILVKGGQAPVVVRNTHSEVFGIEVEIVPSLRFRNVLETRGVGEAVEAFHVIRLGELLQGDVNVVAVALFGYDEGYGEEGLASDEEGRTGGG